MQVLDCKEGEGSLLADAILFWLSILVCVVGVHELLLMEGCYHIESDVNVCGFATRNYEAVNAW